MKPTPKGWPRISSALYYDDPAKAIDWLCRAFGFEVRIKVEGDKGTIIHSELELGEGLIMVAGVAADKGHATPRANGNLNTQSCCVHIDDADAHCARARAAGAKILVEPKVSDYGDDYWADKSYECADPEGHRWWFMERIRG